MIRVIIADDHRIVIEGLTSMLKDENDIEVVSTFLNGRDAYEYLLNNDDVDVTILDINMPELDGAETTKMIVEAKINTKVLVLSMHDGYEYIDELLAAGCSGYILKNKGREELVKAIRALSKGEEHYGAKVVDKIIAGRKNPKPSSTKLKVKLTKREVEIIKLIAREFTTPQIAKKLSIAETTVDTHRRNMISKLGLKSSIGLAGYVFENSILD